MLYFQLKPKTDKYKKEKKKIPMNITMPQHIVEPSCQNLALYWKIPLRMGDGGDHLSTVSCNGCTPENKVKIIQSFCEKCLSMKNYDHPQ